MRSCKSDLRGCSCNIDMRAFISGEVNVPDVLDQPLRSYWKGFRSGKHARFLDSKFMASLRYRPMPILSARTFILLLWVVSLSGFPTFTSAAPYCDDGFLGLSQKELHEKLGLPQAVRDRKSALRLFTYYPITDWAKYFSKLVSPENGEDVYTFSREGIDIRYSFSYAFDPIHHEDDQPLIVRLVDIEFSPAIPLSRVPSLVPEFRPASDPESPSFRSNIWVLLFKGLPSEAARGLVKDYGREELDWTLSYQLFSMQGLPDRLTPDVLIDRLEIGVQSVQTVRQRQRHTHEPILNPYSSQFDRQAVAPPTRTRPIPVPQYTE